MMIPFVNVVNRFMSLLVDYKNKRKDSLSLSWNQVCKKLVSLIRKYPTGVTEAIVLTELLKYGVQFVEPLALQGHHVSTHEKESLNIVRICDIIYSKQVSIDAVLECFMNNVENLDPSPQTKIVRLTQSKNEPSSTTNIEMYLHQKLHSYGDILKTNMCRITNLRLHKIQNKGLERILPTLYLAPILNYDKDKELIDAKFGIMEGIEQEETIPHYTRNLLLRVVRIGHLETIHHPNGESVHCVTVNLTDMDDRNIKLLLWDEGIQFRNLFLQGDILGIEEPFLVQEDGSFHIEHGPATLFYIILEEENQNSSPTVSRKNDQLTCVHKVANIERNFLHHHSRTSSRDWIKMSINFSFLCVIEHIGSKAMKVVDSRNVYFFQLKVKDEFGNMVINVFDTSYALHDMMYPGQMLFFENIAINEQNLGILKTWESSYVYNISSLKGYITSPCLFELTDLNQIFQDGNYASIAKIHNLEPHNLSYVTRVHSSCLRAVGKDESGYFCNHCQYLVTEEQNSTLKDVSTCWQWRFSLSGVLTNNTGQKLKCQTTEQFCEDLLQTDSKKFASMNQKQQKLVVDKCLHKDYVFSITLLENVYYLNLCFGRQ